jgi:hypothetical protein
MSPAYNKLRGRHERRGFAIASAPYLRSGSRLEPFNPAAKETTALGSVEGPPSWHTVYKIALPKLTQQVVSED